MILKNSDVIQAIKDKTRQFVDFLNTSTFDTNVYNNLNK